MTSSIALAVRINNEKLQLVEAEYKPDEMGQEFNICKGCYYETDEEQAVEGNVKACPTIGLGPWKGLACELMGSGIFQFKEIPKTPE
jgi:hypothetical protein